MFSSTLIPNIINEGMSNVVKLSTGAYHVCAITNTSIGRCWGDDQHGQLDLEITDSNAMIEVYTGQWVTC